jgi:AraC-like DNA-binding protein
MHLHMNRFLGCRSRVLNLVLAARACTSLTFSYGVWHPKDPDSIRFLTEMDGAAVAEIVADSEPSRALAPFPALSRLAQGLTIDPHCRVGTAASHLGMTREHASRQFRRHYGLPPAAFRSEQRFRRALTLLSDFTASLASVALDAGYADQAHLTRDVKTRTGMSPAAFRRFLRLDQEITSVQS